MGPAAPPPILRIVVDDREGRSRLAEALAAQWDEVAVGRLPAGDVEIGPRVIVERKTVADFVASLADGRLFRQAGALARSCARPLLVVEGEDVLDAARLAPRSIRGTLLSLAIDFRLPMIRTATVDETAGFPAHLAGRERRRLTDPRESAERTPGRAAMDVLAAIPGVGDVRARRILRTFGSVRAVAGADERALREVEGVGRATARAVTSAFDLESSPEDPRDGVAEVPPLYGASPSDLREVPRPVRLQACGLRVLVA